MPIAMATPVDPNSYLSGCIQQTETRGKLVFHSILHHYCLLSYDLSFLRHPLPLRLWFFGFCIWRNANSFAYPANTLRSQSAEASFSFMPKSRGKEGVLGEGVLGVGAVHGV